MPYRCLIYAPHMPRRCLVYALYIQLKAIYNVLYLLNYLNFKKGLTAQHSHGKDLA